MYDIARGMWHSDIFIVASWPGLFLFLCFYKCVKLGLIKVVSNPFIISLSSFCQHSVIPTIMTSIESAQISLV
jgi:hypothetical protein